MVASDWLYQGLIRGVLDSPSNTARVTVGL